MAYYCGNSKGQDRGMYHETLQECHRLEAHFGERFEPYDAGTHEDVIREEHGARGEALRPR
jgi:hypothetical protein